MIYLKKFSFTSAYAATGAYYDVAAGECRKMFILLLKELQKIAIVLNINLKTNFIDENLVFLSGFSSDTIASMQKDIKKGKSSEKDELIFNVVNVAEKTILIFQITRK